MVSLSIVDSGRRFSWSSQTIYKVICFMSNEFCSHSRKIRWSSVFLFYLQAKGFHDHHKPSTKSSALCPINSAQILEKFGGHLFFFNDYHKPSAKSSALCPMFCSHSRKIRWSSVFVFFLQAKGFHDHHKPSTKSSATSLKRKGNAKRSNSSSGFGGKQTNQSINLPYKVCA